MHHNKFQNQYDQGYYDQPINQSPIYNYGKCELNSHNHHSNSNDKWGNNYFKQNIQNLGWRPIQNKNFIHQNMIPNQSPQFYNQNFPVQNNDGWDQPINNNQYGNPNLYNPFGYNVNNPKTNNNNYDDDGWGDFNVNNNQQQYNQNEGWNKPPNKNINTNDDGWGDFFQKKPQVQQQNINVNNQKNINQNLNKPSQNYLGDEGWGELQKKENLLGISGRKVVNKSIMQVKKKHDFLGDQQNNQNKNNWANQQKEIQKSKIVNPGNDISKLLDQQVIYIEPSPIEQHLEQLKKKGKVFEDPDFQHNQLRLTGQWGYIPQWKNFGWGRLSQMMKNPVIFDGHIEPNDIKQGYLGDCYFLSALAALAERPERIFNLFLETENNAQKYYAVKILYKGIWKTIQIDDWVPSYNNQPAFSKSMGSNGRELWVILLEKAWAKLFGSYKNIEAGFGEEGIHDLTGAHIKTIRFKSSDFDKQATWKYLLQASKNVYSMIGSTLPGSDRNQAVSGIVMGHAYTVLKVVVIYYQGQQIRLVHLRNPWGKTESKTQWNDSDPRWNQISQNEKQRIGYINNINDGSFFQLYKDFLEDFRVIAIAEVNDNASYVYLSQKSTIRKGNYFKVTIHKQGMYSFQINQTPERAFPKNVQQKYKYSNITILIGRINGNQVQYLQGTQSAYRTAFKKHKLVPGQYIVFGKIFFNQYERDFDVTLAVYGDYVCNIDPCPPNISANFKQKLYLSKAIKQGGKQLKKGIFYGQQILKEGYIYIACWNKSQKVANFTINVSKNPNPTVVLKKPYKGQTKITWNLNPGDTRIILARVPDFGYTTGGIGSLQLY